jgi:hypothetical protein
MRNRVWEFNYMMRQSKNIKFPVLSHNTGLKNKNNIKGVEFLAI